MPLKKSALLVLPVVAALTAACGATSPEVSTVTVKNAAATQGTEVGPAPTANPHSERYDTTLTRRDGTLRIEPAPQDMKPGISKGQAWQAFKDQHLFDDTSRKYAADIRFGLYSDDQFGQPPTYQQHPAWVIRWDNVPNELGGHGPRTVDPAKRPVREENANVLVILDGNTGQYITAIADSVSLN